MFTIYIYYNHVGWEKYKKFETHWHAKEVCRQLIDNGTPERHLEIITKKGRRLSIGKAAKARSFGFTPWQYVQ